MPSAPYRLSLFHLTFGAGCVLACGDPPTGPADSAETGAAGAAANSNSNAGSTPQGGAGGGAAGSAGSVSITGQGEIADAMSDSDDDGALPASEPKETVDILSLPENVPVLNIEINEAAQASLEADLWSAEDVLGAFTDAEGARYDNVRLNYRGAYQLLNLSNFGGETRNWKVKFTKEQDYQRRREWNFNSEPHIRQKLAYDLLKFAGVRVPAAQHVVLNVNGKSFGPYLQYADPDSKGWLKDRFGSAAGDLFKAAYDLPETTAYFALLTDLGESSDDYFLHYNKKLNNNDAAASDYSQLIGFIKGLNDTPDVELESWFDSNLDTTRFISYLVVSNFICNWDSYPQRPKNFWLYKSPITSKWSFIPWDLDGTFQSEVSFNYPMSTDASIFQEFDDYMGSERRRSDGEGSARPLVRRLMSVPRYRNAYLARYTELRAGILSEQYLLDRIDKLDALIAPLVSGEEQETQQEAKADMQLFVRARSESVDRQLSQ